MNTRHAQWHWMPLFTLLVPLSVLGCRAEMFFQFFGRNLDQLGRTPKPIENRLDDPYEPRALLAAIWVGHATVLVQIDDKFVLTDPVFTDSVGQISKRLIEPGLTVEALPLVDAVLVSHLHFDHLSLGSLDMIEPKMRSLVLPKGGAVYVPHSRPLPIELAAWQSVEVNGLRITAVPVGHFGWRYAGDTWMKTSYTGYIVEYRNRRVYFGGDTSFVPDAFEATRKRFGPIDLALLPIAPIHPRDFMCRAHVDPSEALDAWRLLGAKYMLPMHYDTFVNSLDEFGEAPRKLEKAMRERGYSARQIVRLDPGERYVFEWKADR